MTPFSVEWFANKCGVSETEIRGLLKRFPINGHGGQETLTNFFAVAYLIKAGQLRGPRDG